jgi:hypothetical protein
VLCDTALMAVYKALNATYPQTIPQAVDNPSQSNTACCARRKKKGPGALSGVWGKGNMVSFATRRTGLFVHMRLVRLLGLT